MTSPLCMLRGLISSLRTGARVSGHNYVEQKAEPGQPTCVRILKCETCGDVHVGWSECHYCGSR